MVASTSTGLLQGVQNVFALDSSSTVVYNPMTAPKDPFKYAPTFTMGTESKDYWEFIQLTFDKAVDFVSTDYIAVEFKMSGAAGLAMGLLENGDRYNNCVDGNKMYFMDGKTGAITELSVLYAASTLTDGMEGILLQPISQMAWQWNNNGSDLTQVNQWYFTANTLYNRGYAITIGNVGVYHGDPSDSNTTYEVLLDVSSGEKKSQYYVDSTNVNCLSMPSDAEKPAEVAPEIAYPFRTGDEALVNGAYWYGPAVADSTVNWQTLSVKFDTATVDMTDAEYLVVEYYGKAGSPGLTYGLNAGDARYATYKNDDQTIWGVKEGEETTSKITSIKYDAVTVASGYQGAVVIPLANMAWQFGSTENKSLAKIDTLTITTNSQYNYAYEVVIGEVGYVKADGSYVSMLDLKGENDNSKYGKYTITSDNAENAGTLEYWTAARKMQGDSTIDFTAKNKTAASFDVWTGGSYGEAAIVQDTYGDDAVQLKATGSNPTGDAYTAITLAGAGGWTWEGMTGVSFWARNDSDTEVSFNLEVDCKVTATGKSDRFNIKQGHRFYLYDVNTGKTTIYMTRPCATLPVGFEGWVYIPFTAFSRADWSNNGVTPEQFMAEGTMVSYLAITIHAGTYLNKAFSVNKFGGYTKVPSFESTYVKSENTVSQLLGLNTNKED